MISLGGQINYLSKVNHPIYFGYQLKSGMVINGWKLRGSVWFAALKQTISRTEDKSHAWEILRDLALHSLRQPTFSER